MGGIKKFPPHIEKLLRKKSYYNLTPEERLEKHQESLDKLKSIPHFDYMAGREALKELRGE